MMSRFKNWIRTVFARYAARYDAWNYRTFSPSNRLRLRNTPRSWVDRDHRFFHAAFTVFLDFVEYEADGVAGLQQRVSRLREYAAEQTIDDATINAQKDIQVCVKMIELYEWYTSINWSEPVAMNDEYRAMVERMQISTEPTDHGTYRIVETGVDTDRLGMLRAQHVVREQQFEKLKLQRLHELCNIHSFFWN